MLPLITHLTATLHTARTRWRTARSAPERGDMPDQIVWIALLVILAITVVGIITAKVIAKANGIGM
ncbi:hypothetical protein KGA66_21520 [Actinocrinis puniceicyclus]|uniref:Uncharacterized protein n=1 Tax=Actinocrinis puniceicyclus TaxID=977794 RepID=A0A8J7WS14_9ACTN|nr:hypothetical protein [Actinocrinis puniceicyclus]MBS2965645.1 hypothetical protein [Actinocrinis puniceicyclus]